MTRREFQEVHRRYMHLNYKIIHPGLTKAEERELEALRAKWDEGREKFHGKMKA